MLWSISGSIPSGTNIHWLPDFGAQQFKGIVVGTRPDVTRSRNSMMATTKPKAL
jgi:hypothetical protein